MAGRIPRVFINDLLARTDIVDLIDARVKLKKQGKNFHACCPFHNEKTPSFTVNGEKQFYHSYGCGAHGNAIDYLIDAPVNMKKQGKNFHACSPFHNYKTPTFTVNGEKQFYHCFGCGAHGNAIDFLMNYDKLEFVETVEELAAMHNLEVPFEAG